MKWSRELRIARRGMRTAVKAAAAIARAQAKVAPWSAPPADRPGGLLHVADFGSNPGRLAMLLHLPPAPVAGMPLIVLLHGCGQTAERFASETGWIALSDRLGIPLLLPEQAEANNRGRCFNWFRPLHTARGQGEALSIREMVAAATDQFSLDPARVFIAGLSAGGAMAAAMLAAYPDAFAAGAIVAGLPVGCASTTSEALVRMAEAGPIRSRQAWAQQVHNAAPVGYRGPWPRISIWHGRADDVVDPGNARLLAEQWATVHGLDTAANRGTPDGAAWSVWGDAARPAVELCMLPDLAHVWPAHAVDHVAQFWGLG